MSVCKRPGTHAKFLSDPVFFTDIFYEFRKIFKILPHYFSVRSDRASRGYCIYTVIVTQPVRPYDSFKIGIIIIRTVRPQGLIFRDLKTLKGAAFYYVPACYYAIIAGFVQNIVIFFDEVA